MGQYLLEPRAVAGASRGAGNAPDSAGARSCGVSGQRARSFRASNILLIHRQCRQAIGKGPLICINGRDPDENRLEA